MLVLGRSFVPEVGQWLGPLGAALSFIRMRHFAGPQSQAPRVENQGPVSAKCMHSASTTTVTRVTGRDARPATRNHSKQHMQGAEACHFLITYHSSEEQYV